MRCVLFVLPAFLAGCTPIYAPTPVPIADPSVPTEVWVRASGFVDGDVQAAVAVSPSVSLMGGVSGSVRSEGGRASLQGGVQVALGDRGASAGLGMGVGTASTGSESFGFNVGDYVYPKPSADHVRGYARLATPTWRGHRFALAGTAVHHWNVHDPRDRFEGDVPSGTTYLVEPTLILTRRLKGRNAIEAQLGGSFPVGGRFSSCATTNPDPFPEPCGQLFGNAVVGDYIAGGVFASIGLRIQLGPNADTSP